MVAAAARASLNGGTYEGGIIGAHNSALVQLAGADTTGWTAVLWSITAYPENWAAPTGWILDPTNGHYISTAVTPPPFRLASGGAGKYDIDLRVNETLYDYSLRLETITGNLGLQATAYPGRMDRDGPADFARDVNRNWHTLDREVARIVGRDSPGRAPAITPPQTGRTATAALVADAAGPYWGVAPGANGGGPFIGAPWREMGRMRVAPAEGPVVAASGTYTMLDIEGAGFIVDFFMSLRGDDAAGRQNTRLKVYVDGELTPSIDVMMVDLGCARGLEGAGGSTATSAFYVSRYVGYTSLAFSGSVNGVGYYLYINIPYTTSIRVDVVNGSSSNAIVLGGYIEYYELEQAYDWGRWGKLHGVSLNGLTVAPYAELDLVNVSGIAGLVHGLYLYLDGGDNNYNYVEGNIKFYIDGEGTSSCEYDSTEDYFRLPWYFWVAQATRNVTTDFFGCTRKNDLDSVGAYRWHIPDPIPFDTGLRATWTNGEAHAQIVNTNTIVNGVLWYYEQ